MYNATAELFRRVVFGVDETQCINMAQRGTEWVMKYAEKLYGLVYNMTANKEDTHDLLQEIFAKAYRSLRWFGGRSSFYTWIYSIAVNRTLNFLKRRNCFRLTVCQYLYQLYPRLKCNSPSDHRS